MTNRSRPAIEESFIATNSEMSTLANISLDTLSKLRLQNVFVKGTHWFVMPGTTRILWNKPLTLDAIVSGANSLEHQTAIEKFKTSLPSSDNYQHVNN